MDIHGILGIFITASLAVEFLTMDRIDRDISKEFLLPSSNFSRTSLTNSMADLKQRVQSKFFLKSKLFVKNSRAMYFKKIRQIVFLNFEIIWIGWHSKASKRQKYDLTSFFENIVKQS